MKNIIVEVPRASIELVLRPGATAGQAVIVTSDEVEIRLLGAAKPAPLSPEAAPPAGKAPLVPGDLAGIHRRLQKLNPTSRPKAVNAIKAMFQFTGPITDQIAGEIIERLQAKGWVTCDAQGKLKVQKA